MSTQDAETDAELVSLAGAGDDAAFARLMTRHKRWTFHFIHRYVGNDVDAYDLLQETFFAAWRSLRSYHRDRPFDAWLRRIALNKCRDWSRRKAVRRLIGGWNTDDEVQAVPDPAPGPAAIIEESQEMQQLEQRLRKLPRSLKEPLLLTAIEGLSHAEAAEVLGLSAKAVETRVYRARARLAKL